jgi:hypothetical protein
VIARALAAALGFAVALPACAQNARIVASVRDVQGRPVADAVIVAVPVDGPARLPAKPGEVQIVQVDREFVPKVTVVVTGTPVAFPNRDEVRHHVYSFSTPKRFELPLYHGVPPQPVVFDKPGVVVLGCNIHDWMVAYVYVSESPHAAKTRSDGIAEIDDVPARSYVVRAWHPQLEGDESSTRRTIEVRSPRSELTFELALKPEVRVRRAPTVQRGGSY